MSEYFDDDVNPKAKKIENKNKHLAVRSIEDLRKVLSTREGRRVIYELIQTSGVHKRSAVSSGSDTYFNEGVRFMGTILFNRVWDNFPEAYLLMSNEAKEDDNGH